MKSIEELEQELNSGNLSDEAYKYIDFFKRYIIKEEENSSPEGCKRRWLTLLNLLYYGHH